MKNTAKKLRTLSIYMSLFGLCVSAQAGNQKSYNQLQSEVAQMVQNRTSLIRDFDVNTEEIKQSALKQLLSSFTVTNFSDSANNIFGGDNCRLKGKKAYENYTDDQLYNKALVSYKEEAYCDAAGKLVSLTKRASYSNVNTQSIEARLRIVESLYQSRDYNNSINYANFLLGDLKQRKLVCLDSNHQQVDGKNCDDESTKKFYSKFIETDQVKRLFKPVGDYLDYLILRSTFEAIRESEYDSAHLSYALGTHADQFTPSDSSSVLEESWAHNYTVKMNITNYLRKNPRSPWRKDIKAMEKRALEIAAYKSMHVAAYYTKRANYWKNPGLNPSYGWELVKNPHYKQEKALIFYLAAAKRAFDTLQYSDSIRIKHRVNIDYVPQVMHSIIHNLKNSADLINQGYYGEDGVIQALYMSLDPYKGISDEPMFDSHPNTITSIKKEIERAATNKQAAVLGIELSRDKYADQVQTTRGLYLGSGNIGGLFKVNQRRVQIWKEHSQLNSEELNMAAINKDFGSLENLKNSYYYKKFQRVPMFVECKGPSQTTRITEAVADTKIDEKTGDFSVHNERGGFPLSPDFPRYLQGRNSNNVMETNIVTTCPINSEKEIKYSVKRVWNTQSDTKLKVAYLWEDHATEEYTVDEAAQTSVFYLDHHVYGMSKRLLREFPNTEYTSYAQQAIKAHEKKYPKNN